MFADVFVKKVWIFFSYPDCWLCNQTGNWICFISHLGIDDIISRKFVIIIIIIYSHKNKNMQGTEVAF